MAVAMGPLAFAALLEKARRDLSVSHELHGPMRQAMQRACFIVQRDAQGYLGTYRQSMGPFPAWARLADTTNADRERKGYAPDKPLVRTGDLGYSIEFRIEGTTGHVGSDSEVAAYLELGTTRIPARSFLGRAGFANEYAIHKLFAHATFKALGLSRADAAAAGLWDEVGRMATVTLPSDR